MRYGTGRSDPDDRGDYWGHQGGEGTRRYGSQPPRRGQPGPGRAPTRRNSGRGYGDPGRPGGRPPGRRPRPPARTRLGRFWRAYRTKGPLAQVGYATASLGAVAVLTAGIGGYEIYQGLLGNIHKVNVGGLTHRSVYGVQNLLVLGSQQRKGQKGFGGAKSYEANTWVANSDNLLIVHLDPTHTHAVILSIPRDTMVYEPGCKARNHYIGYGVMGPYTQTIIDGALNIGGPTCAVKTVEDLTGLKFDHFVEFDFNSFRQMVDAIGGVTVCVPKGGYYDAASKVHLSAGKHHVTYNQALAYVRVRHILGGAYAGGDVPRIKVQQAFISSVIQEVSGSGLLSSLPSLLHVASIATRALTVDEGLGDSSKLIGLARSLSHLKPKNVTLLTMPFQPDPADANRLLPQEPQDDVIFQMIQSGAGWPVFQEVARGHLPLTPPHKIQVRVLNGAGQGGLALRTARALRALGFDVVSKGDTTATSSTTIQYSGTAQADAAYTLGVSLHQFPATQNLIPEPQPQTGQPGVITLVLGSDYANFTVNAPSATHPAKSKGGGSTVSSTNHLAAAGSGSSGPGGAVQGRSAAANICNGLPLGNG